MNLELPLNLGVVLVVYYFKCAILLYVDDPRKAVRYFGLLLASALVFVYAFLAGWGAREQSPLVNLLGLPAALLAVPAASFGLDLWRRKQSQGRVFLVRWAIEMFIVAPAWYVLCVYAMLWLGWIWI